MSAPVEDCLSALYRGGSSGEGGGLARGGSSGDGGGLASLILNSIYLGLVTTLQDAKVYNCSFKLDVFTDTTTKFVSLCQIETQCNVPTVVFS